MHMMMVVGAKEGREEEVSRYVWVDDEEPREGEC